MKNFFYENGALSGWRITFLTLLLLWCASLFFKNAGLSDLIRGAKSGYDTKLFSLSHKD